MPHTLLASTTNDQCWLYRTITAHFLAGACALAKVGYVRLVLVLLKARRKAELLLRLIVLSTQLQLVSIFYSDTQ